MSGGRLILDVPCGGSSAWTANSVARSNGEASITMDRWAFATDSKKYRERDIQLRWRKRTTEKVQFKPRAKSRSELSQRDVVVSIGP